MGAIVKKNMLSYKHQFSHELTIKGPDRFVLQDVPYMRFLNSGGENQKPDNARSCMNSGLPNFGRIIIERNGA